MLIVRENGVIAMVAMLIACMALCIGAFGYTNTVQLERDVVRIRDQCPHCRPWPLPNRPNRPTGEIGVIGSEAEKSK